MLQKVADQVREQRTCQVVDPLSALSTLKLTPSQIIDPSNWKPVHMYTPGVLEASDVRRLKEAADGYLRVVFR